jgi:hypothetical protein
MSKKVVPPAASTASTAVVTQPAETTPTPAPTPKKEAGLSPGATIGIVLGCINFLILFYLIKDYIWSFFAKLFGISKGTSDYFFIRNA